MDSTNGSKITTALFVPDTTSEQLAFLEEQLTGIAWPHITLHTEQDLKQATEISTIILVVDTQQATELLTRQLTSSTKRPFVILVSDDNEHANSDLRNGIDATLPNNRNIIASLLPTLLSLASHNQQLHNENMQLKQKVEQLERDIDRQRRLTEEIDILKNAIVRNVSHELKTPLLQVKSAVSLIREDMPNSTLVQYAENATARLESHVKNITMLGSALDYNIGPIILRDAADYAKRNIGRVWQYKGEVSRIQFEIAQDLPPVMADKQGLSTVLQLLFDNALKFSEKDVHLIGRQEGDQVYVAVEDQGIGIDESHLGSIFDTFYQIDSSSTRRYGGTGVGLAIVRLILDHHGTDIKVSSVPDKGSSFAFVLPIADLRLSSSQGQ